MAIVITIGAVGEKATVSTSHHGRSPHDIMGVSAFKARVIMGTSLLESL